MVYQNFLLRFIGGGFVALLGAAFFVWVLVNWATGCGETIYTATGSMPGECVSMVELWGPVFAGIL